MVPSPRLRKSVSLPSRVIGAFALVLLMVTPASAQQTGTLSGLVHDAQGGVLPGVAVTVTRLARGASIWVIVRTSLPGAPNAHSSTATALIRQ